MPRQGSLRVLADVAGRLRPSPPDSREARRSGLQRWIDGLPGASPSMRRFLSLLAPPAARNRELECTRPQRWIAGQLGISTRAVKKLVARARANDWLGVNPRAHGREKRENGYRLLPPWAPSRQYPLEPVDNPIREGNKVPPGRAPKFPSPPLNARARERVVEDHRAPARARAHASPPPWNPPGEREGSPSGSPCREAHSLRSCDALRAVAHDGGTATMSDVPSHKPRAPDWRKALRESNAAREAGTTTAPPLPPLDRETVRRVWTTPCTRPGCAGTVTMREYADRTEGECSRKWFHD